MSYVSRLLLTAVVAALAAFLAACATDAPTDLGGPGSGAVGTSSTYGTDPGFASPAGATFGGAGNGGGSGTSVAGSH